MHQHKSIWIPASLFKVYLRELKPGELKVLLVLIWEIQSKGFQTYRVSITHQQLCVKTGLSRRTVVRAISNLVGLGIVKVYGRKERIVLGARDRMIEHGLFYEVIQY